MDHDTQALLETLPDDEPRSRLEHHRELILRLRRQGRTYRRIRQILAEKRGLTVSLSTLHGFVERRARRVMKSETIAEDGSASSAPTQVRGQDRSEQMDHMRALRNKPAAQTQRRRRSSMTRMRNH